MAVRAADKVEREINHEGLQATEPQGSTTITISDKPLIIMTRRSDEWLEVSEVEDTHLGGRGEGRGLWRQPASKGIDRGAQRVPILLWWGGSYPYRGVLVWSEQLNRWHSPRDKQSSILTQSCSSGRFPPLCCCCCCCCPRAPTPLHYLSALPVTVILAATNHEESDVTFNPIGW
jgi:hypothetical protein